MNAAIAIISNDSANTNRCIINSAKHNIMFSFSVNESEPLREHGRYPLLVVITGASGSSQSQFL